MLWTAERIDLVKTRWAEGASAAEIAVELACGLSRSAVLGKVFRLGLSGGRKQGAQPGNRNSAKPHRRRTRQTAASDRRTTQRLVAQGQGYVLAEVRAPAPATTLAPTFAANPVTLIDLEPHHCRFPVGDPQSPDFRFCGGDKLEGAPYCPGHARLAYTTVQDRAVQRAEWRERHRRAA